MGGAISVAGLRSRPGGPAHAGITWRSAALRFRVRCAARLACGLALLAGISWRSATLRLAPLGWSRGEPGVLSAAVAERAPGTRGLSQGELFPGRRVYSRRESLSCACAHLPSAC